MVRLVRRITSRPSTPTTRPSALGNSGPGWSSLKGEKMGETTKSGVSGFPSLMVSRKPCRAGPKGRSRIGRSMLGQAVFSRQSLSQGKPPRSGTQTLRSALADFDSLARANSEDRKSRANQAEASSALILVGSRRAGCGSPRLPRVHRDGPALLGEDPNDLEVLDKHASSLNNLSILLAEAGQSAEQMRRTDRFDRSAGAARRGHPGRRSAAGAVFE